MIWRGGGGEVAVVSFCLTYLFIYLLTYSLHGAVLHNKLTGSKLVKKFPAFYGTRRFITALTSARHLFLSWTNSIQSPQPPPTSWRSILILSSHLRHGRHFVMNAFSLTVLSVRVITMQFILQPGPWVKSHELRTGEQGGHNPLPSILSPETLCEQLHSCGISGFHSGVNDVFVILGCYAVWIDSYFTTFRGKPISPISDIWTFEDWERQFVPKRRSVSTGQFVPRKWGATVRPETSVNIYWTACHLKMGSDRLSQNVGQ